MAVDADVEYLFYVGCAGSFDDRGKKVTVAFAKILQAAGVSFASWKRGKLLRRLGHAGRQRIPLSDPRPGEHRNDEGLRREEVIETCPHGYNALEEGLSQLRRELRGLSPTEIIADLIAKGKNQTAETRGRCLHLP
jgi:Fe-S oxidoreductase